MKNIYKLCYKVGKNYIPINLNYVNFLEGLDVIDIKTIDEFTTHFNSYEDMLDYLMYGGFIPENIKELYVAVQDGKEEFVKLYAYNKTIFFKKDKEKLRYSYVYGYITKKFENGNFILSLVEHYERKYEYKKFTALKNFAKIVKEGDTMSLTADERFKYLDEIDELLDFVFVKQAKQSEKTSYKNIRDFLCYINGEEPIKVRGNKSYSTEFKKGKPNSFTGLKNECIDPDNVTLDEYIAFNKGLANSEKFEAYRDGNDFIAPISNKEAELSLNASAKKYCLKRDNGEYE